MALLHRRSTSKRASQKMWENNAAMPDDASANDNVSSARPEPAAFVPTPFDEVIDISDLVAERRRLQRNLWAMRIIAIVLLIAAIAVACFPLALQFESDRNAAAQGGSQASGEDSASKKDKEYQSLLNTGNGVMGTIKVPKQSINLPFYHGTSEEALASGAGHLYGTSLPVGGKSTHSVITGHRGLVEALMFTRLDEVKEGDFFYIEVMGETLGYKVDRISVILPDDTSKLKIVPGEDRVTLMTCTPYGVNTHRLLISGHRVAIPMPAPEPNDVLDARNIALGVGLGILAAGLFIIWLARRHKAARIIRHGAFWPWMIRWLRPRADRPVPCPA